MTLKLLITDSHDTLIAKIQVRFRRDDGRNTSGRDDHYWIQWSWKNVWLPSFWIRSMQVHYLTDLSSLSTLYNLFSFDFLYWFYGIRWRREVVGTCSTTLIFIHDPSAESACISISLSWKQDTKYSKVIPKFRVTKLIQGISSSSSSWFTSTFFTGYCLVTPQITRHPTSVRIFPVGSWSTDCKPWEFFHLIFTSSPSF